MSKTRQPKIRTFSARFSPKHRVEWHSHSWSQLIYATSGVFSVETETSCWVVPTRRAIWVPAGCQHSLRMQGSVFLQTVYFEPQQARASDTTCSAFEIPKLLHELIVHVCNLGMVEGESEAQRTLIRFFADQLEELEPFPSAIPMPQDARARKLAQLILGEPGARKSLDDLCKECRESLRTMQRVFSAQLGIPFARWRNQVKMVTAVQMLGVGRSVTETAIDLGFDSVSAFICSFRRYFGESPGKYAARQFQ